MATYTTPEMPLVADVWYTASDIPPGGPPDGSDIELSLSPIKPGEYVALNAGSAPNLTPTHIIRTSIDHQVGESYLGPSGGITWPATVYEVPQGSGHYYYVIWSHEVGAGFPNHFQRIYVYRMVSRNPAEHPFFRGWI